MTKLSASEKEKTKMRERNRRAITTKIFQGLRKHGGYNLAPRADINEVLRCLAAEAGWIVHPDGTTYRASQVSTIPFSVIHLCSIRFSFAPLQVSNHSAFFSVHSFRSVSLKSFCILHSVEFILPLRLTWHAQFLLYLSVFCGFNFLLLSIVIYVCL